MIDLLLINPALAPERVRGSDFVLPWADGGHGWLPLSSLFLASYLGERGFSVQTLDMELHSSSVEDEMLKEAGADARYIGLSAMTAQVPHALLLTKRIKKLLPRAKTVWGGIHASLLPQQTVAHPAVDYVVVGEGEEPLARLLAGESHPRIGTKQQAPNLGVCTFTHADDFVDPDYSLLDIDAYLSHQGGYRNLDILTSRGCPRQCSFCVNTIMKYSWRAFSAERSIALIRRLREQYSFKHTFLMDENFFGDRARARQMLEGIADLGITWEANVAIKTVPQLDDSFLKLVKASGGRRLRMGAESGSDRILKILRKGITRRDTETARDRLLAHGIKPCFSFMIDLPDERPDERKATLKLARACGQAGCDVIGPQKFRPYPGSDEFDKLVAKGLKLPKTLAEWSWCNLFNTIK
jgi:radical SAM superfamily enzyme YgiQ (UPF0313 family)